VGDGDYAALEPLQEFLQGFDSLYVQIVGGSSNKEN
jgi:hypothetical protein